MVLKIYLFQTMANNQWRQPVDILSEDEAIGTDSEYESGDEGNEQENAMVSVMPSCENMLVSFQCSHTGFVKICVLQNFVISKNNVNVK